jgi:hypothetical protein
LANRTMSVKFVSLRVATSFFLGVDRCGKPSRPDA